MNRRPIFLATLFLGLSAFLNANAGRASTAPSWKEFAGLLGLDSESAIARLKKFGPVSDLPNARSPRFVVVDSVGVTVSMQDRVEEIHYRVEPSAKIAVRPFAGDLPLVPSGDARHEFSLDEAIRIHGEPVSRTMKNGYDALAYHHEGFTVVLYFSNSRLAGVSLRKSGGG